MLPEVAVLPSAYVDGADTIYDKAAPLLPLEDFEIALTKDYPYDAHTVSYVVADSTGTVMPFPRVNKPALREIRAMSAEVFLTFIAIDIDSPGHIALSQESHAELEGLVAKALPQLPDFTAYYTTRAGVRFIYVLEDPIPVDKGEGYILAIIQKFKKAGIRINPEECKDWTRLFRLPKVLREGTALGHREFDECIINHDTRLDLSEIEPVTVYRTAEPLSVPSLENPLPDDLAFTDYCEDFNAKGKVVESRFFKEAKKTLKGRMCFPALFENKVLAHAGARDNTIQRLVGEVCSLLVHQPGAAPEGVYALFLPAVIRLVPDGEDWRRVAWRAICKYWPREIAKLQMEEDVHEDVWNSVIGGMRKWDTSSAELFSAEPHVVREYVLRHGIIATSDNYFILTPKGTYETTPTDRSHIIARIRELGMDRVLQTHSLTNRGQEDRSIQGMLNANVAAGFELDGVVTEEGDGTINGNKRLQRCLFRRKHLLEPEPNTDVDAWLRIFAGAQYEKLCRWIGLALAWDEGPICALSVRGSPGCGKKLLVRGLVETVDTEKCSDATEFGQFKSGIGYSPFLVVNEGFPARHKMPVPPADAFRQFVGGDPIRFEEKYKVPITVRNPLRVIFTTNNDDIVNALAGGRDLTPYDRDAIAQRLFHIDVPDAAAEWLMDLGGLDFTKGWIAGDSGRKSRYVVAKHFLYLHSIRSQHTRGRFLMEGSNCERLIKAMTLRSGAAPAVFEILTRLIELAGKQGSAVIEGGAIFVTENMVEKYEQREHANRPPTSHHVIRNVIAAMRMPGTTPIKGVKGRGQDHALAVWHQLNGRLILEEAIERGLPSIRLQKILGMIPDSLPQSIFHGLDV